MRGNTCAHEEVSEVTWGTSVARTDVVRVKPGPDQAFGDDTRLASSDDTPNDARKNPIMRCT